MAAEPAPLRIGLVGSGFMGRAHAFAAALAARAFDLPRRPEIAVLADAGEDAARRAAGEMGIPRWTGDWRTLLDDPAIDVIDITAPNRLHHPMAMAAIAAGKHVCCEKPLAPTLAEGEEMRDAARRAGVVTQVGFNYIHNPLFDLARGMIVAGEIGRVLSYRGQHAEDYMADPAVPVSFRTEPGGGGVLADLGSHALATAEFLLGPIARVSGELVTVHRERPDGQGGMRAVDVDDIARAGLRFASGAEGQIEASWVATGRKMAHDFEVFGEAGALAFRGERLNELQVYSAGDAGGRRGFRTILAGAEHAPYGRFSPAPGHQLGFNEIKAIEIARFAEAVAGRRAPPFDFAAGARSLALTGAIDRAAAAGGWQPLP